MIIQFVNGVNIPTDDSSQKALAKKLGQRVIKAIKDPSQFDGYVIGCDIRRIDGSVTNNRYDNFDFTPQDVKGK